MLHCCHGKFKHFIIGLALLIAVLASILPKDNLMILAMISRFFEIMIPFLGVGALVKYLCCDSPAICAPKKK